MRHAVTFGVMQYINAGNTLDSIPKIFLSALETLEDDPHYEVHEALGVVSQARGNLSSAKSYYEKSISYILKDPNIDGTIPPWSENISRLKSRIQSLNIDTTQ
jgi:hypothetical protein